MVTENERKFARFMVNVKKRYESKFTILMAKAIRKDMAYIIDVTKQEGALMAQYRAISMKFPEMLATLYNLWETIYPLEAERMYRQLKRVKAGLGSASEDWLADLRTYLELNVNIRRFLNITDTQRRLILTALDEGVSNGDSIDEIVKELEAIGLNTKRARLIARSEANSAVNAGHYTGAKKQTFIMDKVWVAAMDQRTRGSTLSDNIGGRDKTDHWELDGNTADMDGMFKDERSGSLMLYPGDSSNGAGAGDIANCRCTVVFRPRRDADGRLIKR